MHASSGYNSIDSSPTATATCTVKSALTAEQVQLYREVLPFYDLLRRSAIGVDPLCPDSSIKPRALRCKQDQASSGGAAVAAAAAAAGAGAGTVIDHGLVVSTGTGANSSSISRLSDPRNANILIWVGDRLLPRELAKVSVFDSSVQGGDAVWEGLRVYGNSVFKLEEHINRLFDSAKAMAFENVPSRQFVRNAIISTLNANGMNTSSGGAHMRMTLSRGAKLTSSMNPQFNVFGTCLLIVPEWKPVGDMATYDNKKGIKLITAAGRRNSPQCVDSKIHHSNLINNSKCCKCHVVFICCNAVLSYFCIVQPMSAI